MAETSSTYVTSDNEPLMIDTEASDVHKSILDVLKAPQRSDLVHKRSVAQNYCMMIDGTMHQVVLMTQKV